MWQGEVEVFELTGHPKANRCFAWSHREGTNDQGERVVAVLEIPPLDTGQKAVQAAIVKDARETMTTSQLHIDKVSLWYSWTDVSSFVQVNARWFNLGNRQQARYTNLNDSNEFHANNTI